MAIVSLVLAQRARSECAGYPLLFEMQRVMMRAVRLTPPTLSGKCGDGWTRAVTVSQAPSGEKRRIGCAQ